MSDINDENLPSIEDYSDNSDGLPSIDDFLTEEELPSVQEFVAPEEVEEENQTIEDAEGNAFLQVTDVVKAPEWSELVRLVNNVRESIPDIPEIKYYDKELEALEEEINQVRAEIPKHEIEAIYEQIDSVRTEINQNAADIPEIKYYDEQVENIENKIDLIQQEITNLPEPKYYEEELQTIKEELQIIRDEIPKFPKWVNEVNEVPDFSWIGKTFSVIDDDFIKVGDNIKSIKNRIDREVNELSETIETKEFESKVDIKKLNEDLVDTKDKIYKELKEAAIRIWDHHDRFKDDDRKLKKQVLSKLNETKQNIEKQIDDFKEKNHHENKLLTSYFEGLKGEIDNLPQVKYYDNPIKDLKKDLSEIDKRIDEKGLNISELYKIVEELRVAQEGLLNEPSDQEQSVGAWKDPLTPLDQNFVTLKDLQQHYKLFVNRVSQQLATFGGGGAVQLQYLDDIVGVATNISAYDGMYLQVDTSLSSGHKFIFTEVSTAGAAGTWATDNVGVFTSKYVGINTTAAKEEYPLYVAPTGLANTTVVAKFDGDISVAGTIFKENIQNLDSVGIVTAGNGFRATQGGIHVKAGISTFNTGIGTINVGLGETTLIVDGDARVTGILTIGTASITIDGTTNTITVGDEDVTITNSAVTIGSGVTISATASGINSAPNVLYVAKDGDDTNNGTSIDNAFLTISGAVGAASSGTTIKVLSGKYTESNPIEIPAFVSIVGDDQRTVQVSPSVTNDDLFHVRKGTKLANMTFKDHVFPAAAVGFPTSEIAENVGGGKWKGPYIQNCTSDTTTGKGIYIDGDQARLLKAMNVDAFTQYNEGGVGVAVTNGGFAQLVSLFTICCNEAVTCHKGGQADIANSNCSFGTYGLVAKGVSDLQYTGVVTSSAAISQKEAVINISTDTLNISGFQYTETNGIATVTTTAAHGFQVGMGVTLSGIGLTCTYGTKTYPWKRPFVFTVDSIPSTTSFVINAGISTVAHTYVSGGTAKIEVDRPYDGQLVYFDQLYKNVKEINVTDGGSGYTSTPTITVEDPSGPSGETCTAYATVEDEAIKSITIISGGSQYEETPDVTFSGGGGSGATASAVMEDNYYTINSSTPVSSGITTVTLSTNLLNTVGVGSTAFFNQASRIIASSHTFEYVGSGNFISTATPQRGGVTIQANEVVTESGGQVLYTSTDQGGNFRIGDDLQINQETGTISGRSFSKSLFNEMTPFILALS